MGEKRAELTSILFVGNAGATKRTVMTEQTDGNAQGPGEANKEGK
jgi:hypothetical protein